MKITDDLFRQVKNVAVFSYDKGHMYMFPNDFAVFSSMLSHKDAYKVCASLSPCPGRKLQSHKLPFRNASNLCPREISQHVQGRPHGFLIKRRKVFQMDCNRKL